MGDESISGELPVQTQDPEELWHHFYESGWKARQDLFEKFAAEEGADLASIYRALKKVKLYETQNRLSMVLKSGKTQWNHLVESDDFPTFPTGKRMFTNNALLEQVVICPTYASPVDFLVDFLSQNQVDAVLELGAGDSWNLIELYMKGGPKGIPYYSGEYTTNGVTYAEAVKRRAPQLPLVPFKFDHTHPDLSVLGAHDHILVFTCHSIEQVEVLPVGFFEKVSRAGKRVSAFHFEPFGYQYSLPSMPIGKISERQQAYFEDCKWNKNFVEVLLEAEALKLLEIHSLAKNIFLNELASPTSFAYWTSGSRPT